MKVSFEHDLAHNYVIPEVEGEPVACQETEYEIHMLEENQIPGFMDCVRKKINGKDRYYYEITSRQSLAQICENEALTIAHLQILLHCLYQALLQMDPYLLDGNKIVLEPELIYLDIESREAVFCYWPLCGKTIQDSFRIFASYLLYHLERTDTEAVLLMYEINRKVQEKNYALMDLLQSKASPLLLDEQQKESKERTRLDEEKQENVIQDLIVQEDSQREIKKKTKKKEKKNRKNRNENRGNENLAAGVIFLVVLGIVGIAARMEFLTITQAGGIAFLIIGGMAYILSPEKKRKRKKEKKKKEQEKEQKEIEKINWEVPEHILTAREREHMAVPQKEEQQPEEMVGATTLLWEGGEEYQTHLTLISMNARERNNVVLVNDSYLIGKLKAKVDIYIDDASISRIHAKIQKEEGEYYLYDMNSTNGTFLNGKRLGIREKVLLQVSDEIAFADLGYYVGNT